MHISGDIYESRGAYYDDQVAAFTRLVDVSGLGMNRPIHFDHAFCWMRETSACVVVVGPTGREVGHSETHNDFYGFLTSIREAGLPGRFVRDYAAAPGGPITVTVQVTVADKPVVIMNDKEPFYQGAKRWTAAPRDWMKRDDALIDAWLKAERRWDLPENKMPVFLKAKERKVAIWTSERLGEPIERQAEAVRAALLEIVDGVAPGDRDKAAGRIERYLEEFSQDLAEAASQAA